MITPTPDDETTAPRISVPRANRLLVAVIACGGLAIALIGFIGSYSAVQDLAADKGFGAFAHLFPLGIDSGIVVLLSLDLLLSHMRIPFPLLRQTAWLLTAATIAFNGAASWPDPLGVAMHAVIPMLFVVTVEAARHAVGRVADVTADKHMEGVRLSRWLLSPVPTFKLWRRMKLWELRSYDHVITLERDRLVYETKLATKYGPDWRSTAPAELLLPLRLAKYGVPVQPEPATALPPPSPGPAPDPAPAIPAPPRPPRADPGAPADGRAAVKDAYESLSPADAALSARKLAQQMAPVLGLTENTVRIYVTALRKERATTERRQQDPNEPGTSGPPSNASAQPLTEESDRAARHPQSAQPAR
ncbi:DUF2637 domain-containing protein [Streptomyces globisporus]|uniref:DUF2637 domain-containing protein n=1 Tax=Streptomyces globisporus TaxID=1908 RepID=UPI0036DE0568